LSFRFTIVRREFTDSSAGCNPKLDSWECLKVVAERAELGKDSFWLHKFGATFATTWSLWAGVNLRTVQLWLGHGATGSAREIEERTGGSRRSYSGYELNVMAFLLQCSDLLAKESFLVNHVEIVWTE
jgi:hypothetical protein